MYVYIHGYMMCTQIEHGQDVSWLSELREVSVLFINLDPGRQTGPHEKQALLQESFDVVYPALIKFDGTFTKCIYNHIHMHASNTTVAAHTESGLPGVGQQVAVPPVCSI